MTQELIGAEVTHQTYLERLANGQANDVVAYLERAADYIRGRLTRTQTLTNSNLPKVLADVEAQLDLIYSGYTDDLEFYFDELAQLEIAFQVDLIGGFVDRTLKAPATKTVIDRAYRIPMNIGNNQSAVTLRSMVNSYVEASTFTRTGTVTSQVDRVLSAIVGGQSQGLTTDQIVRNIIGTRSQPGILQQTRKDTNAIARTATSHIANQGRAELYKQNDDIIIGYQLIATLDNRTSAICFTGATEVTPIGRIDKLYRSDYRGEIITLDLPTGEKVEGTPNHPILTQHGWTPLGEIDPSEHVVYRTVGGVSCVNVDGNVNMPTTFSELYDSLSETSIVDVLSDGASATDFYGDGQFMDGKVHILSPKCSLRSGIKSCTNKLFINNLFGLIHGAKEFSASCGRYLSAKVGLITSYSSHLKSRVSKVTVKTGFGDRYLGKDFVRSFPILKHLDSLLDRFFGLSRDESSWSALHESELLEKVSHSGGGSVELLSNLNGRNPVTIKPSNICGVRREFRSCHVYTLSCGQGYYDAGGILVKNCRSYDQRVVLNADSFKPIPPFHYNERTITVPYLAEEYRIPTGTRASRGDDGGAQVPGSQQYYTFLKNQNAEFQDDVLGPTLGKAFRNAGLSPQEFRAAVVDRLGNPLTLTEIRAKDDRLARYLRDSRG